MKKSTLPHLFLFIVNLFYGAGFTISKIVMPEFIQPFGFILLRVAVTTTLFFAIHRLWIREKLDMQDIPLVLLCGLFGVVVNQEMFFWGLSITTPINASLIMIITPILVFCISFLTGHEKATIAKITGLILGLSGALIIIAGKGFSFSGKTILGDLFIFINATSYALYLVAVRPLMKKYHPITVIKWVFFFGLFPVTVIGFSQFQQISWTSFPTHVWLAVSFVIVCTTFLAYLLNILALREVHSSVVGAYIYLQPIIASIISISMGVDKITFEKILSACLIFTGVYLVSFGGKSSSTIVLKKIRIVTTSCWNKKESPVSDSQNKVTN